MWIDISLKETDKGTTGVRKKCSLSLRHQGNENENFNELSPHLDHKF
jgi:hypothetical protein